MTKRRLELTGIGLLAFISAGLVGASALAQGEQTGTVPPPVTTETAPTNTAPTTTATVAEPVPPTPQSNTRTVGVTPPPPLVVTTESAPPPVIENDIPAFFTSKYTPEKDKASTEKPTATWRWAGTDYFQQIGVTPNVFAPGMTQSSDPIVDTFVLLQPRFAITKDWQLRVRMTASYELTNNSNSTTTRSNEIQFGDITPTIAFLGIPKFGGIKTAISAGFGIPVSPQSQARTMIISPVVGVSLVKIFENALKGELSFTFITQYSHPIYRYSTGGLNDTPVYQPACFGASDTGCGLQGTGAANPENNLNVGAIAAWQWGKFSVSALYYLFNTWTYQLDTPAGVQPEPGGSQAFRQLSYFNFELDWDFTSYLTGAVGYQMYRTILTGESTIGNPFYDPYQDMRIFVGATVHLDKLYDTLRGVKEPEKVTEPHKGVVHVENERKPVPQSL